jgi:hypothetical protein
MIFSEATHIANNCLALSLIQVIVNGVFEANLVRSVNSFLAFSALHNIVVNAIVFCSKLFVRLYIALLTAAIQVTIATVLTILEKALFIDDQTPLNLACNLLNQVSQVLTKLFNCLFASVNDL